MSHNLQRHLLMHDATSSDRCEIALDVVVNNRVDFLHGQSRQLLFGELFRELLREIEHDIEHSVANVVEDLYESISRKAPACVSASEAVTADIRFGYEFDVV